MIRTGFIILVAASSLLWVGCSGEESEQSQRPAASKVVPEVEQKEVTAVGMTFQWRTDTLGMLHVKVSAPTQGWVGVGFHPTDEMKDADFILGYLKDGELFIRDDFGTDRYAHKPDTALGGEDNLMNEKGLEKEGHTEIHFSIPLDSGDAYDRSLTEGDSCMVLLAYGADDADDFTSRHEKRAHLKIRL